jgi:aryl-phospho-beta-D-glucosidase BglC (GH1 family)
MAPKKPASKAKPRTYNKAKAARKSFKRVAPKYSTDQTSKVCATYVNHTGPIENADGDGLLVNEAIANNQKGYISACLALHTANTLLACPTHSAYKNLYHQFRTNAVYIDILINKRLREVCDAVFLLVETGNGTKITDVKQMITDVNHKMYKCNNNIQVIRFKHIFNSPNEKLWKQTTNTPEGDQIAPNNVAYLKVLAPINNQLANNVNLDASDCQIEMRVKFYNQYKDMKALSLN